MESPLRLIEILASVAGRLDPSADVDKILKKVRFLSYELMTFLGDGPRTDKDKLVGLRDFFFREKAFHCRPSFVEASEQDYLLHDVISRRSGSPVTLGLLFRSLGRQIQLNVDLVVVENLRLLKFIENGQCHFLDILKNGEMLSKAELLELLNRARVNHSDEPILESLSHEQIVLYYLVGLKRMYQQLRLDDKLMNVLNVIVNLHAQNLGFLAERALLRDRLGESYEALLDLKRYFSFYDERHGPEELVHLYRVLKAKFGAVSNLKMPFK